MKTALVTGASAGIGRAFALELAARGVSHLILTARRADRLEEVAHLARSKGARATCIPADLSQRSARLSFLKEVDALGEFVDLVINNAGFGSVGPFAEAVPEWQMDMVAVNVEAPVHLTRHFLPMMLRERRGTIVNVASTAAFQPLPNMATYAATKAFLVSFSVAVATEAAGSGVEIVALCPGPTESEFHLVAGLKEKMAHLPGMTAEALVEIALANLGRKIVVAGCLNRVVSVVARHLPQGWVAAVAKKVMAGGR